VALWRSWRFKRHVRVHGPALWGSPSCSWIQDRGRWDQLLIHRGLAALDHAEKLGGTLGPYALQAAIAACHASARTPGETDWARIVALYEALAQLAPSPVVELNRAVAVANGTRTGGGPCAHRCADLGTVTQGLHLLPSVRGDLLRKLGRFDEARAEFETRCSAHAKRHANAI